MREKASAPITSARLEFAAFQVIVGGRQGEDEAGADRLHVEGGALGDAEIGLDGDGGRGKGLVRGRGGEDDEVDVLGLQPGVVECRARRRQSPWSR